MVLSHLLITFLRTSLLPALLLRLVIAWEVLIIGSILVDFHSIIHRLTLAALLLLAEEIRVEVVGRVRGVGLRPHGTVCHDRATLDSVKKNNRDQMCLHKNGWKWSKRGGTLLVCLVGSVFTIKLAAYSCVPLHP